VSENEWWHAKHKQRTELEEVTASDKRKMEIWNCLKPSTKGDTFVQCSTCQTDFSQCVHGGRLDRSG